MHRIERNLGPDMFACDICGKVFPGEIACGDHEKRCDTDAYALTLHLLDDEFTVHVHPIRDAELPGTEFMTPWWDGSGSDRGDACTTRTWSINVRRGERAKAMELLKDFVRKDLESTAAFGCLAVDEYMKKHPGETKEE